MKFWESDQTESSGAGDEKRMEQGKDGEVAGAESSDSTTSDSAAQATAEQQSQATNADGGEATAQASSESKAADSDAAAPAPEEAPAAAAPSAPIAEEKVEQVATAKPTQIESMAEMTGKPAAKVPLSKDPNHFIITVGEKTPDHPFYEKGHKMGFSINNVPGGDVVVERGKSYKFEVITNPLHDVYISEKDVGWGSLAWNKDVNGQFIYNGTFTFSPKEDTPDTLYYSCRNHPFMGGTIHVANPGQKIQLAKRKETVASAKSKMEINKGMVQQKHMFADMLIKSNGAKRIQDSDNAKAKQLLANAENLIKSSKADLSSGKMETAYKSASQAVEDLKEATRLVPTQDELAEQKEQYKEVSASLADFEKSHKKSYDRVLKKQGKDAVVMYDKDKVEKLKGEANTAVKDGDYAKANKLLQTAQREVTLAIKKMMDSQTVVYDLNFESAEEEYEYELRRFHGYEILIPIAIQAKKPEAGTQKLMENYADKGRGMREEAIKKAKEKDFPTAIAMLLDATKEIRRALSLVGINQ